MRAAFLALLILAGPARAATVSDTLDCTLPSLEARANPADGTAYDPCAPSANPERRLKEARLYRWFMGEAIPTVPILVAPVGHKEGLVHTFIVTSQDAPRNYCATAVDSAGNESCRTCITMGAWPVAVEPTPLGPVGQIHTMIARAPYRAITGATLYALTGGKVAEATRQGLYFEKAIVGKWWGRVIGLN